LIHCRSGCDRTGLVSALALLLRTEATLGQARRQLSLYYGHYPFGLATCLDRVLDDYEDWLRQKGLEHRAAYLRQWAHTAYAPHDD
jgi:protein tyrosine/serine phosphatase